MKQSRTCVFCGGAGLTKEHLFANWLTELFPRVEKDKRTFGATKNWPDYTITSPTTKEKGPTGSAFPCGGGREGH
jgi:hypothetical protein